MFPGECDRCGGPQSWTYDACDEVWVRCQDPECVDDQLVFPGLEDALIIPLDSVVEPGGEIGVLPPEGGATEESNESVLVHIGVPLEAVLHSLWVGGPAHG